MAWLAEAKEGLEEAREVAIAKLRPPGFHHSQKSRTRGRCGIELRSCRCGVERQPTSHQLWRGCLPTDLHVRFDQSAAGRVVSE